MSINYYASMPCTADVHAILISNMDESDGFRRVNQKSRGLPDQNHRTADVDNYAVSLCCRSGVPCPASPFRMSLGGSWKRPPPLQSV